MIISDLNYLETAETSVVGGFNLGYDFSNLATAEADAYGSDTLTQTFAVVYPWSSTSVSIAATN
ncbi:MAG: hypothetical protein EAZ18_22780 [Oscillatoriales cyanobacterium]|nr:MAG: hypothetical protein EAZ18_22780 [Oscillatoriales cyanobacterium]